MHAFYIDILIILAMSLSAATADPYSTPSIPQDTQSVSTDEFKIACKDAIRLSTRQLRKLVKKKAPVNPPANLHDSLLHGTVKAEICLSRDGKVRAIHIIEGHPLAINSVIESVRRWEFQLDIKDSQKRSSTGILEIEYDFRSTGNKPRNKTDK